MWLLKWFRKSPMNLTSEYTTYMGIYEMTNLQNNTKVVITIHLPSKRVSEKHFNTAGVLTNYIHNSPAADQHIEYICAQDNKLALAIEKAQLMWAQRNKSIKNRQKYRDGLRKISWWTLIIYIIAYFILTFLTSGKLL